MIARKEVPKQYGQATVRKTLLCRRRAGDLLFAWQKWRRQSNASEIRCRVSEHYGRNDSSGCNC